MDPGCRPKNGGFVGPKVEANILYVEKVVEVEKITESEDNGGLIAAIVITIVLLFTAVCVGLYLYFACIRRNRH